MGAKMGKQQKAVPSFTLRIRGKGISPEVVPVRTLSDAASAVMRLLSGDSAEDLLKVHVLGVRRGSAVYPCLIDGGTPILAGFDAIGAVARLEDTAKLTFSMLSPIRILSEIAKKFEGVVEVFEGKKAGQPAAVFAPDTYSRIRGTSLITDDATVSGILMRVGGAEDRKCSIRIPGRASLLYCRVKDEELSRKLGQHLYECVTLHGQGTYFARTWDLINLRVTNAVFPSKASTLDLLRKLRQSSGNAWDDVLDVSSEIRSMR
jgi:hypothetical protein